MEERGATEDEVREAILTGEREAAKRGLSLYRSNFQFQKEWAGEYYAVKQVAPVVDEEPERFVVITVYTFYFSLGETR